MEAFILKLSYTYPSEGIVEAVFKFQLKMNGMDAGIVVLVSTDYSGGWFSGG